MVIIKNYQKFSVLSPCKLHPSRRKNFHRTSDGRRQRDKMMKSNTDLARQALLSLTSLRTLL